MGKAKKNKVGAAQRYTPYGKDPTRITDLCNMLSTATAGTINEGNQMDDAQPEDPVSHIENEEGDGEKRMTKGKILQRHKREWKALRSKLEDMKSHKKAMGERTLAKKNAKKDLSKEIKAMQEELVQRHKRELEEFEKEDCQRKEEEQQQQEATMSD